MLRFSTLLARLSTRKIIFFATTALWECSNAGLVFGGKTLQARYGITSYRAPRDKALAGGAMGEDGCLCPSRAILQTRYLVFLAGHRLQPTTLGGRALLV